MNILTSNKTPFFGVLSCLIFILFLMTCSPSAEAKNPRNVMQSYEFLCNDFSYKITLETIFKEREPPLSQLRSILVNKKTPKNLGVYNNLAETLKELATIELPPVPQCHRKSATLSIRSFESETGSPLLLNVFFYENGEIDFMYFDISEEGRE